MIFRPLTAAEIEHWYAAELRSTFPPQECKPLADIFALLAEGRYELWGLFQDGLPQGFAAIMKAEAAPLVLLDYLSVTAARRGGGLGAQILELLRAQDRLIVAEAELPLTNGDAQENGLRLRRIEFYKRSGFTPAYRMAACGLCFQALLSVPADAPEPAMPEVMDWHRRIYGPARTDVQIPLLDGVAPPPPYWINRE